jgi:glyoxylase-like metal-dependent hydrolase (beta-lactamase superfamily II)
LEGLSAAKGMVAAIGKTTGLPIKLVANTHFHLDPFAWGVG